MTVTNTDDSGPGSLRDAIATADSGTGAETIVFAPSVAGTIELTGGPLSISHDLTIDGPGAGKLAVSGRGASRVFVIEGGSYGGAGRVIINDVTIEDGRATSDLDFPASGGGVLDLMAALKLDGCVFDGNRAPLSGAGTMIYRGSLAASGTAWSNNTVLGGAGTSSVGSDNLGGGGIGVAVFASRGAFDGCAFASNTLATSGTGDGGGILAEAGSPLSVSRSDFDGNGGVEAGGGIGAYDSDVIVLGSSFTANSSQFAAGAIEVVRSSSASTPQLLVRSSGFLGNVSGYAGGAIRTLRATASVSESVFSANQVAGFQGLSADGGGAIAAMGFSFSPADLALPLTLIRDTFVRNQAVLSPDTPEGLAQGGAIWDQIAMTISGGTFTGNSAVGSTGQGGAIADDPGTAVSIARSSFAGNEATGRSSGGSGGAIFTTVQPTGFSASPTTTAITGCSFVGNTATAQGQDATGGAIADGRSSPSAGDSLDISASRFSGNGVVGAPNNIYYALGGAIDSPSRPLSVTSCSFWGNQAIGGEATGAGPGSQAYGGAIEASGPSLSIDGSRFLGNTAQGQASGDGGGNAAGGALSIGLFGGTQADVSDSSFVGNLAADGSGGVGYYPLAAAGGAIAQFGGSLDLSNDKITGNEAFGGRSRPGSDANPATGGGIYNGSFSTLTMTDCSISGNTALGGHGGDAPQGGGRAGAGGDAAGGGIYNLGVLTISDSVVAGNAAIGGTGGSGSGDEAGGRGGNAYGGGIAAAESPYIPGSASFAISRCIVAGNSAIGGAGGPGADDGQGLGGGIAILGGSAVIGKKTKVFGNVAATAADNIYTAPGV